MKKLFSNISLYLLLISALLFVYILFRDIIIHDQQSTKFYLKYYYFTFLLAIFSIITFYIKDSIKKNIILFASSVLFALYLVEIILFFSAFNYYPDLFKKPNQDLVDRYEYFQKIKKQTDKKVSIIIHSSLKDDISNIFPLGVISNTLTINCNENGYYSSFESDRYGFNNNDKEWDSEEINFLLLGDSYVQGACVMFEDTITGNLKKDLKKTVLNLGNGGNGPLKSFAALKEYFPEKRVNNVLFFFAEINDIKELNEEIKNPFMLNYIKNENFKQNLKLKQNEINDFLNKKSIREEIEYLKFKEKNKKINIKSYVKNFSKYFFNFIKLYNLRYNIFEENLFLFNKNFAQEGIPNEFITLMSKLKMFTEKNGSKLYFVYLPEKDRYLKNYSNTNREKILNILNDLNINVIDITQSFANHKNIKSLFPLRHRHYNEKGYEKVSEVIKNYFEQN